MDYTTQKVFPTHYPTEIVSLLEALSMTTTKHLKIVGSASLRASQYAGDIDAMEDVKVKTASEFASALQEVVKRVRVLPNTYIMEIKCGEIPEWNVFQPTARIDDCKIYDFNPMESKTKVDELRAENIISEKEAKDALALLDKATTLQGFLEARKEIRFHILRWTVEDILEGAIEYRGAVVSLEDAIQSGGLTKIDTVSNIRGIYTEISILYNLTIGREKISGATLDVVQSLKEDILYYNHKNAFKALKRLFALAKNTGETTLLKKIMPILNSDLGRLNQIAGDIGTLVALLDRPSAPIARIRIHIRNLQERLGGLYQFKDLLQQEGQLTGALESILRTSSKKTFQSRLVSLEETMKQILHHLTLAIIEGKK
jgi:hypothetical protein